MDGGYCTSETQGTSKLVRLAPEAGGFQLRKDKSRVFPSFCLFPLPSFIKMLYFSLNDAVCQSINYVRGIEHSGTTSRASKVLMHGEKSRLEKHTDQILAKMCSSKHYNIIEVQQI